MTDRYTADTINSDALDALYDDLARYEEVQGEMNDNAIDLARRAARAEAALSDMTRDRNRQKWYAAEAQRKTRVQRDRAKHAESEVNLLARTIAATSKQTVAQVLADVHEAVSRAATQATEPPKCTHCGKEIEDRGDPSMDGNHHVKWVHVPGGYTICYPQQKNSTLAEPEHVCKPGASLYYCPTSGETESDCHGGFDVCCDRPDLHRPIPTGLREQYAAAIGAIWDGWIDAWVDVDIPNPEGILADAVLAVRDRKMEQLDEELDTAAATTANLTVETNRLRAELADEEEATRRILGQRQELAAERYAWQEHGDRLAATLREVLAHFTHETHPGQRCLQTGHVPVGTVDRWRAALNPPQEPTP